MSNNEDFKFTRGDLVYVVNFCQQYSMYYKAMGELLSKAYNEPFLAYPICIGGSLKKRGWGEGEELFRVISCGYPFPYYRNTKFYLLASEEEFKKYKDMNSEERNYYPFPVYVVSEEGLEEVRQKVFLVEFFPKSSKADFKITNFWLCDELDFAKGNGLKDGEVTEDFSNTDPKQHRLLVSVTARNENEAKEKGGELIREYLIEKMNRLFEERGDVEWMLRRLKEKLEEER